MEEQFISDLTYTAKWTVLDTENTEPDEATEIIETLSKMDKNEAVESIKNGLQVEIDGDMLPAADCNVEIGDIIFANDRIEIKHLELKWASEMSAEEYADEYPSWSASFILNVESGPASSFILSQETG